MNRARRELPPSVAEQNGLATQSEVGTFLLAASPRSDAAFAAGRLPVPRDEAVRLRLAVGQPLAVVREPAIPYDARAVRIDWRGHKLGYLPRIDNAAVAQMLDCGERMKARIAQPQVPPAPWERVAVEMELAV